VEPANKPEHYAIVRTNKDISNYLPERYFVLGVIYINYEPHQLINGVDFQGWSLKDYVIPRLASGMFHAEEILTHHLIEVLMEHPQHPEPPRISAEGRMSTKVKGFLESIDEQDTDTIFFCRALLTEIEDQEAIIENLNSRLRLKGDYIEALL